MSARSHLRDASASPSYDSDLEAGDVSSKLQEQLNSEALAQISQDIGLLESKLELQNRHFNSHGGSMGNGLQSFLKWVGLSLPLILAIIGATVWINSTIDSKVRENRLEMKADLDSARIEIKSEAQRTQDAVMRLDDKVDRKMDKLSDQLTIMQQEFRDSKK